MAAADTPYTVVPTKRGFDVQLDTANGQWWELFARIKMRKSFRWRVAEKRGGNTFTITDREVSVDWRAGTPSISNGSQSFWDGVDLSTLSWNGSWKIRTGRIIGWSRQNIWAMSDRGRIERVVDYKFNAREGRDLIRMVAKQSGLKERQPLTVKMTWAMVSAVPIGFGVYGLVELAHNALPALG
ncbi:hypothetical protein [Mycobacterium sp. NPDC050441]|uniref:hypothetical protein n=1 Tax=Mycobacterium sp. NPDC050441 TaxID=3155403 RepID=UPI0033CBD820